MRRGGLQWQEREAPLPASLLCAPRKGWRLQFCNDANLGNPESLSPSEQPCLPPPHSCAEILNQK